MTTKKRVYKGRNTGLFFGYLKRITGYTDCERECIASGVIDCYLVGKYGNCHGRRVSLSELTDQEYEELLDDLKRQVNVSTRPEQVLNELQEKAIRKDWYHRIFGRLSRIGVSTVNGYEDANLHIRSLPISRGRILPAISLDELPDLFKAVCSYCDNIQKKQQKERASAFKN